MKKLILAICVCLGSSIFLSIPNAKAANSTVAALSSQDYCPSGYICEATNLSAKGYGSAKPYTLSGISVYKSKDGDVIAYVPGHGRLRCYWSKSGETGWHFDANGGTYVIQGYSRR